MEVVRQRGVEMLGGEAQAVHRTAEGRRCQREGLQGRTQEWQEWPEEETREPEARIPWPSAMGQVP